MNVLAILVICECIASVYIRKVLLRRSHDLDMLAGYDLLHRLPQFPLLCSLLSALLAPSSGRR